MNWLALLRRFWPALPVIALALWAGRLEYLRAGYRADLLAERSARALDAANGRAAKAQAEAGFAQRQASAATSYADRLASREPIILRSTNTVREYAQTAAGRVLCRDPDRVRSIDLLDADLAHDPAPASGGAGAVRADTAAPPAGTVAPLRPMTTGRSATGAST